jgi:toxin ParE1/3/4
VRVRLTREADAQIAAVLSRSLRLFGAQQMRAYAEIIRDGLELIGGDPLRPASLARDEIARGLRSFHLELVRRRRRTAAHVLFYLISERAPEVIVVGVLHERMEPRRRLSAALRSVEASQDQKSTK